MELPDYFLKPHTVCGLGSQSNRSWYKGYLLLVHVLRNMPGILSRCESRPTYLTFTCRPVPIPISLRMLGTEFARVLYKSLRNSIFTSVGGVTSLKWSNKILKKE